MELTALLILGIKVSIVLLVLGLGLNSSWSDALYLFRHPGLLVRSLFSMNVVMPLVAAGLVVAFDLPPAVEVALVALAVSPVPPMLPSKELKAGGRAAYAIGLFVAIALLAIVVVPLAVALLTSAFDRAGQISPMTVAKTVLATVLVPVAIGVTFKQWFPAVAEKAARPVSLLGLVLLVVSALPMVVALWPAIQALFGNGTVLIIALMAVIGLAVGHVLGGPDAETRTVLALSTAARHPAVALGVAVASGVETRPALAAILLYVLVATIVAIPYVAWRKRQLLAARASLAPSTRT